MGTFPPPGNPRPRGVGVAVSVTLLMAAPLAGQTAAPANGFAKAKSSVAHADCLKQCHQRTTAMQYKISAKPGPLAVQQGPINTVCMSCHQGPPTPQTDMGAPKLPTWKGSGSSHMDGPFLERTRGFFRVIDTGTLRGVMLTVQCNGCHNVHSKDRTTSLGPTAFDTMGRPMKVRPTLASQVCFGCHAGPDAVRLARTESDLGALFGPGRMSAHTPGLTMAARPDLPSLRQGVLGGPLDCTSCHNNSDPNGPRGPHASAFPKILKASFGREGDIASTGDRANALCYTCHEERSILGNRSFPLHAQHINGFTSGAQAKGSAGPRNGLRALPRTAGSLRMSGLGAFSTGLGQPTPCATCHDPHGSRSSPALISFDKSVVSRASVGVIDFQRTGLYRGSCTLTCHGFDHVQTRY